MAQPTARSVWGVPPRGGVRAAHAAARAALARHYKLPRGRHCRDAVTGLSCRPLPLLPAAGESLWRRDRFVGAVATAGRVVMDTLSLTECRYTKARVWCDKRGLALPRSGVPVWARGQVPRSLLQQPLQLQTVLWQDSDRIALRGSRIQRDLRSTCAVQSAVRARVSRPAAVRLVRLRRRHRRKPWWLAYTCRSRIHMHEGSGASWSPGHTGSTGSVSMTSGGNSTRVGRLVLACAGRRAGGQAG